MTEKELADRMNTLSEHISDLRAEVAERRPVGDLIKYLLYFWAAISLVLGVLGWRSLSDLEQTIEDKVQLQLPRDKAKYAEYEQLIDETQALYKSFEALTSEYKARVDQLEYADIVAKDFDIEGQLLALEEEVKHRIAADPEFDFQAEHPFKGSLLEPEWRTKAIAIISDFRDSIEANIYPADFIFNIAQTCRMLNQFELARDLTKAAEQRNPSPPITAMALASQVTIAAGAERDRAFSKLMHMVRNLGPNNPQIVLAEAWNAAENERRYAELTAALEGLLAKKEAGDDVILPSYAYVILARSVLRAGSSDAVGAAERALDTAWNLAQEESPLAQWYDNTISEAVLLRRLLEEHGDLPSLDEAAAASALPSPDDLRLFLESLMVRDGAANQALAPDG